MINWLKDKWIVIKSWFKRTWKKVLSIGIGVATATTMSAVIPVVKIELPKESWIHSYETVMFDTPDGDLDIGQYADTPNGNGYFYRITPKESSEFYGASFLHTPDFDVSGMEKVNIVCEKCAYYTEHRDTDGKIIRKNYNEIGLTPQDYKNLGLVPKYDIPKMKKKITLLEGVTAGATIAYNGTFATSSCATCSSHSYSKSVAGSDPLLVVSVGNSSGAPVPTVTAASYNASGLTLAVSRTDAGNGLYDYIYYLANASSGSNTVSITLSASVTTGSVSGALTYTGIDTDDPLDTTANNGNTSNVSTGNVDIAPTVATETVTVDSMTTWARLGSFPSIDGDQDNERYSHLEPSPAELLSTGMSDKIQSSTGSIDMGWSFSLVTGYTTVAAVFNAAAVVPVQPENIDWQGGVFLNPIEWLINKTFAYD